MRNKRLVKLNKKNLKKKANKSLLKLFPEMLTGMKAMKVSLSVTY